MTASWSVGMNTSPLVIHSASLTAKIIRSAYGSPGRKPVVTKASKLDGEQYLAAQWATAYIYFDSCVAVWALSPENASHACSSVARICAYQFSFCTRREARACKKAF